MENSDFKYQLRILSGVTLIALVLVVVLPIFDLPTLPVHIALAIFFPQFALRTQARRMPEMDVSWKNIYLWIYGNDHGELGCQPIAKIEHYFHNLRNETPTIYHASAIQRLAESLPDDVRRNILKSQSRYAALVGIDSGDKCAADIMRDRAKFPQFITPNERAKTAFSDDCVDFCESVTAIPELLIRIVIAGEFLNRSKLTDCSRMDVVRDMLQYGNIRNVGNATEYLAAMA